MLINRPKKFLKNPAMTFVGKKYSNFVLELIKK